MIHDLKQYKVLFLYLKTSSSHKFICPLKVNSLRKQQRTSHYVTLPFRNWSSTYSTHSTWSNAVKFSVVLSPENEQSQSQWALRNKTHKMKKPLSLHRLLYCQWLQETSILKIHKHCFQWLSLGNPFDMATSVSVIYSSSSPLPLKNCWM